jgi:O-6-methylguanine DNA methyltransferase
MARRDRLGYATCTRAGSARAPATSARSPMPSRDLEHPAPGLGWLRATSYQGRIVAVDFVSAPERPLRDACPLLDAAEAALSSGRPATDLPMDLPDARTFTGRVYRELMRIPPGETTTYLELARRAGSPRGARAVGQAMARNRLPVLVPCHRAVASGGGLGGFSGGLERKRALLLWEGALGDAEPTLFGRHPA